MPTKTQNVKCKICGSEFPTLVAHVKRKHNLSTAEYLKQFPNSKICSDEYRRKTSESMKAKFAKDPAMRVKVASRTFDFVGNKELALLLQRDYKSAKICLKNLLWKPSIILYGSIIEAILKEQYPRKKEFYDIIEKAYKDKIISEKEYHKIHIVRDLRNYVHIHKELSEKSEINEYWARTFADICEAVIRRFKR